MDHLFRDHVALADRPVASLACDSALHVHLVAEVNILRQLVNANPGNRVLVAGGGRELLDVRAVCLDGAMAGQAEALCGKTHDLARVRILVARSAVQSESQVRLVTIRNRLLLPVQTNGEQDPPGDSKQSREV